MSIFVCMPTFGMTEGEATITRWLKAPGEQVVAGESLFEAETDKAILEVPAPASGTLSRIDVGEGGVAPYRSVVAYIAANEVAGGTLAAPEAGETPHDPILETPSPPADPTGLGTAPSSAAPGARPAGNEAGGAPAFLGGGQSAGSAEIGNDEWVKASPLARRVAAEHRLDLRELQGSGPGGRIIEADVRRALADRTPEQVREVTAPRDTPPVQSPELVGEFAPDVPVTLQPLSSVKQLAAQRTAESYARAPHFYLQVEVRARRLVELRAELLPAIERSTGARLSFTDLLLRALAMTLPQHPVLNATWQESSVGIYGEVSLGVAVAAPRGLVVPVIGHAGTLSLAQLVRERSRLAEAARANRLAPQDLAGGTFTLTNLGMFGIDSFLPVLNPPQAAILAAGAIAERPVGVNGQLVLQPTLHLTLAVDHRVADGAQGAAFLRALRELLEAPSALLL